MGDAIAQRWLKAFDGRPWPATFGPDCDQSAGLAEALVEMAEKVNALESASDTIQIPRTLFADMLEGLERYAFVTGGDVHRWQEHQEAKALVGRLKEEVGEA